MKNLTFLFRTIVITSLVLTLASFSTLSVAKDLNRLLKGVYATHQSSRCLGANPGLGTFFNGALQLEPLGFENPSSSVFSALTTYNGDGTGHQEGQLMIVDDGNATLFAFAGVSTFDFTCDFTYTVHADSSFDASYMCTFIGTGAQTGVIVTNTTPLMESGFIQAGNRRTLITHQVTPTEDFLHVSIPAIPFELDISNICVSSGTQIKIKGPGGDDDDDD